MATKKKRSTKKTSRKKSVKKQAPARELKKVPVKGFAAIRRTETMKPGAKAKGMSEVKGYLARFGYLAKGNATLGAAREDTLDKTTSEALKSFQRFNSLKETGEFDARTRRAMSKPRCGLPDFPRSASAVSSVAFNTVCSWDKRSLTYAFDDGTNDVPGAAEFAAVRRAFDTWSDAAPLTFTEVAMNANPDIVIDWRPANDPDHSMVGGVLAHADFPPGCGVVTNSLPKPVHFDDTEHVWADGAQAGAFDVETVALHEIGHILGLAHSGVSGAVMAPSVSANSLKRSLTADDLSGVRALYPAFLRRGDSGNQAGFISEQASVRHRTRQVVNAVRTRAGTLKLIAWRVNTSGSVTRTGDSGNQAGAANHIDIDRAGTRFVVACRTGSGRLKLISWSVNNTGTTVTRRGDSANQAGAATLIKIVALSGTLLVTACRTGSKRLRLITWRLNPNGSLTRLNDSANAAGTVKDISMVEVPRGGNGFRVVTSVRTAGNDLKLIVWNINATGAISRRGDSANQAGTASMIESVRATSGHVVTAVRTASNRLKLISWTVSANGATVTRRADSGNQAGIIKDNALMARPGTLISAVKTNSGNLKLILWRIEPNGSISRRGDSGGAAGTASRIGLCQQALAGSSPVVTSCRTASDNLRLITWDDTP